MMASETPQTLIVSVQRALQVIDIVANASRPLPVKAVASATGLSLGTAYNITRTLIHEGYLVAEPDGLVLGARFPALRAEDEEGVFLAKVRSALRFVVQETGHTAYLSRYVAGEIHVVDIVDAPHSPRVPLWVGLTDCAHATALGRQILATLRPEERVDYLHRRPVPRRTPHTIIDREALLAELASATVATIDDQEFAVGYTCVAVPVQAPGLIAALAISVPVDHIPEQSDRYLDGMVSSLQQAARRLSSRLAQR